MIQEVLAGTRKKRYASSAPTLQASPQALLRVLDDKRSIAAPLKTKFKAIFDRYESLVKLSSTQITATRFKVNHNSVFDPAPEYLRSAHTNHVRTFSPLELVVTAILVTVHMDHRSDIQLLEDVKEMRTYLRRKHKDLRVNAQCWATAWTFITEEMVIRRGAKNSLYPSIEGKSRAGESSGTSGRESSGVDGSERDSSPLSSAPSSPEPVKKVVVKKKARLPQAKGKRKAPPDGKPRGSKGKVSAKSGKITKRARLSEKASTSKKKKAAAEAMFENL